MSASDYAENRILDAILGDNRATALFPATVYIALYTAAPTDAGGGTEVSGGSYARVAVTNNSTNWPNAASSLKRNGTVITFPEATVSWGTITHFGVFDAASGGNLIAWGALGTSKVIGVGDQPEFKANTISFTAA